MADPVAKAALDRAMEDKEQLVLLYQPIHDARTGTIWSAEALLRQRRENGEIREASIINEAADRSRGPERFTLDHYLIRRAYTDAGRWQSHAGDVRLNVNLSPRDIDEGNVSRRLLELVRTCGNDIRKVNIEITETAYIEDPEKTMRVLESLRDLGPSLWLDDFGTGHSSLTHLQHFPIDGIKLPGDFVRPLPDDRRARAIVAALVDLAHDLGLAVIAEEVERREQLDFLLEHRCDYIQGFLFSRPMTLAEFENLLGA
jgi:EAL domain-containing protein (putative c-di-GMP-specific phosphodiesterase class I)